MEYRLLVDLEVIEVMDRMPKAQRRRFLALFDRLRGRSRAIIQITMKPMLSGDAWKSVSFRPGRSTTGLMALIGM
jgi:hypothetical protein